MKNLDQIRAGHAVKYKDHKFPGKDGGQIVKKISPMIRENGLLAAIAFAVEDEEKSTKGHAAVFKAFMDYKGVQCSLSKYLEILTKSTSAELRAETAEINSYLNYLRRFAE
jgi:CRISPR/Cas system CMR-associated protein Cmr5 small subunit